MELGSVARMLQGGYMKYEQRPQTKSSVRCTPQYSESCRAMCFLRCSE